MLNVKTVKIAMRLHAMSALISFSFSYVFANNKKERERKRWRERERELVSMNVSKHLVSSLERRKESKQERKKLFLQSLASPGFGVADLKLIWAIAFGSTTSEIYE